ncbi:MAG: hypothetical protein K0R49_615 [Burkholderiales bacterium]|jgi:hypothetical protein|nr:hypothetical protein [Burkholderiales bacterium]
MILEHRIFFNQSKLAKKTDNVKPTATFTLSLSSTITTGKKFRSIIHKINKTFFSCDFMLCDTLDRYNTIMHATHTSETDAYNRAYICKR